MATLSNNRLKTGLFLTMATLILVFAAAALAAGPGGRFGHGMGKGQGCGGSGSEQRLEVLTEKLALTEDQVAAIGSIWENRQEKGAELRKEMMRLQNELEGEMLKDVPNEKTAVNLVEEIGALRTELKAQGLKSRLEVRQQLTPEQRDQMLMMKEGSRRGHGRKGGRGMGSNCDRECDGSGQGRGHQRCGGSR